MILGLIITHLATIAIIPSEVDTCEDLPIQIIV